MTEVIAPTTAPRASAGVKALAVLSSIANTVAVVLMSISLAAFRIGYDGEDVVGPRFISGLVLAIILMIVVTTVIGWRSLGRRPRRALLVMGAPGGLMALLMIVGLVSAGQDIARMRAETERAGWPTMATP